MIEENQGGWGWGGGSLVFVLLSSFGCDCIGDIRSILNSAAANASVTFHISRIFRRRLPGNKGGSKRPAPLQKCALMSHTSGPSEG